MALHRQVFYGRPGGATHLRSDTATHGGGRGEGRRLRHQQGCAQRTTAGQYNTKARPAGKAGGCVVPAEEARAESMIVVGVCCVCDGCGLKQVWQGSEPANLNGRGKGPLGESSTLASSESQMLWFSAPSRSAGVLLTSLVATLGRTQNAYRRVALCSRRPTGGRREHNRLWRALRRATDSAGGGRPVLGALRQPDLGARRWCRAAGRVHRGRLVQAAPAGESAVRQPALRQ